MFQTKSNVAELFHSHQRETMKAIKRDGVCLFSTSFILPKLCCNMEKVTTLIHIIYAPHFLLQKLFSYMLTHQLHCSNTMLRSASFFQCYISVVSSLTKLCKFQLQKKNTNLFVSELLQ